MRFVTVPLLFFALLALPGTGRGGEDGADDLGRSLVRQFRSIDFEQFREAIPRFGGSSGFFPKIFSDELFAGSVVGTCRRYPERLADLMPSKVQIKDGFREHYYGALLLGGGDRALALLRAEKEPDAKLKELLDLVAKRPDAPRSPTALDPFRSDQAEVLFGVLLMRSDAACAMRLATCLAPVADDADEGRRAAADKARERAVEMLRPVCAEDAELRATFRDLRALSTPAVREQIDRILAEEAGGAR